MNKKLILGIMIFAVVVPAAFTLSCTERRTSEPPIPPPTAPVTPGYIQTYDHKLGFGFEYPESWEMEVPQSGSSDEGTSLDKFEVYTKKGEPT